MKTHNNNYYTEFYFIFHLLTILYMYFTYIFLIDVTGMVVYM